MTQYDLTNLLADAPKNCWLALHEEQTKVVGRGETMKEAIKDANDNGVKDPIVMWAPKQWRLSVFEVNRWEKPYTKFPLDKPHPRPCLLS